MNPLLVPANGSWYTPEEKRRIDLILASEFYLLRNDASGTGERYRCGRCGRRETHFTLMCIERPFDRTGLRHMYLSGRVTRIDPARPSPLARLGVSDLAAEHPRTARELGRGEQGDHWFAFLLGTADPLTPRRAQELADRIRAAGARFALQPLAAVAAAQPILQEVS